MQEQFQVKLPQPELDRLRFRIESDYRDALSDHQARLDRWAEAYRRWRQRSDPNGLLEANAARFNVPITAWQVRTKWAKEIEAMLGEDAEIVAVPQGPSDQRRVHKLGRYMSWRVFHSMRLTRRFGTYTFRKLLYGRTFAYTPWRRDVFQHPEDGEIIDYEGPDFIPLRPDDVITPAEEVETVHQFSWVIRAHLERVDDLLEGEAHQQYQSIKTHLDKLIHEGEQGDQRDQTEGGDQIQAQADEAEGVAYDHGLSTRDGIRIFDWMGRWRMLKGGARDAAENDLAHREERESHLLVRYCPAIREIVGVQDLRKLYPDLRNPRPLVEAAMPGDGTYWPPSFGEMLATIEEELSANHELGTEAGQMSVGPVVFYKPAQGMDVAKLRLKPYMAIPSENPTQDVHVVNMRADLNFPITNSQALIGYAERLTGITDQNLGRTEDRPNAPRTVGQTVALLEEGNVRAAFDTRYLREDAQDLLLHIWRLDTSFAPEEQFFRVTEDEAQGQFDVENGHSTLTKAERDGRYDFVLKFATSAVSKELKRTRQLELYSLDLQNPLIASNPRALWMITRDLHQKFGDERFAALVPEPPETDAPISPREELARLHQGEEIHVRPMDDDMAHIIDHDKQIQRERRAEKPNPPLIAALSQHYMEHVRQMQQKKLMQALVSNLAQQVPQMLDQLGPLNPMGGGVEQAGNAGQPSTGTAPGNAGVNGLAGFQ